MEQKPVLKLIVNKNLRSLSDTVKALKQMGRSDLEIKQMLCRRLYKK